MKRLVCVLLVFTMIFSYAKLDCFAVGPRASFLIRSCKATLVPLNTGRMCVDVTITGRDTLDSMGIQVLTIERLYNSTWVEVETWEINDYPEFSIENAIIFSKSFMLSGTSGSSYRVSFEGYGEKAGYYESSWGYSDAIICP